MKTKNSCIGSNRSDELRQLTNKFAIIVTIAIASTSCLHAQPIDQEEMAGLNAALLKVSSTVHNAVLNKNADPTLSDAALLSFATAHMPSYLNRFDGYVLKARQEGKKSSVLVCDKEAKLALIEDAGCTSSSDWQTSEQIRPCEYVLDLTIICPVH